MSDEPSHLPLAAERRIPAPPPKPKGGTRRRRADRRWLIYTGALAIGVAVGIGGYRWIPRVDTYFDYWLAVVLS